MDLRTWKMSSTWMFPDFSSIQSSSSQIVTVLTSSSVFSEQADQFSEPLRTLKRIAKASADPQVSRIELETFPAKISPGKLWLLSENFAKILKADFRTASSSLVEKFKMMSHNKSRASSKKASHDYCSELRRNKLLLGDRFPQKNSSRHNSIYNICYG